MKNEESFLPHVAGLICAGIVAAVTFILVAMMPENTSLFDEEYRMTIWSVAYFTAIAYGVTITMLYEKYSPIPTDTRFLSTVITALRLILFPITVFLLMIRSSADEN